MTNTPIHRIQEDIIEEKVRRILEHEVHPWPPHDASDRTPGFDFIYANNIDKIANKIAALFMEEIYEGKNKGNT